MFFFSITNTLKAANNPQVLQPALVSESTDLCTYWSVNRSVQKSILWQYSQEDGQKDTMTKSLNLNTGVMEIAKEGCSSASVPCYYKQTSLSSVKVKASVL